MANTDRLYEICFCHESYLGGPKLKDSLAVFIEMRIDTVDGLGPSVQVGTASNCHILSHIARARGFTVRDAFLHGGDRVLRFYDEMVRIHGQDETDGILGATSTYFIEDLVLDSNYHRANIGLRALQEVHAQHPGVRIVLEAAAFFPEDLEDPDDDLVLNEDEATCHKMRDHAAKVGFRRLGDSRFVVIEPGTPATLPIAPGGPALVRAEMRKILGQLGLGRNDLGAHAWMS